MQETWRPGFDPWFRKIPWRWKWQPTPVFLPGESHGQRSLVGYSPWVCTELGTAEHTHIHFLIGLFLFVCCWVIWAICIFWKTNLCRSYCLQLFLPVCRLSLYYVDGFPLCAKPRSLNRSHLFIFAFISVVLGDWPKKTLVEFMLENVFPMFPFRNLWLFIFKFSSHFGFIFVYGVRLYSNLIDLHVDVMLSKHHLLEKTVFSPLLKINRP